MSMRYQCVCVLPCLYVFKKSFRLAHCEANASSWRQIYSISPKSKTSCAGTTRHTGTRSHSRNSWFVVAMLCVSGLYQSKANGRHSTPIFVTSPFRMVKSCEDGDEDGVNTVWSFNFKAVESSNISGAPNPKAASQTRRLAKRGPRKRHPKRPSIRHVYSLIQYSCDNTHYSHE